MAKVLTRDEKQAKLKQGYGTFTYLGGAFDTDWTPGEPALGADGKQLRAASLVQAVGPDGKAIMVLDSSNKSGGVLVWKKPPELRKSELKSFKVRAPGSKYTSRDDMEFLEFNKGEPVEVRNTELAQKLRGFKFFREEKGAPEPVQHVEAEPKKKGKHAEV